MKAKFCEELDETLCSIGATAMLLNTSKLFVDPECVLKLSVLGRIGLVGGFSGTDVDVVVPNLLKVMLVLGRSKVLKFIKGLLLSKFEGSCVFFTAGLVKGSQFSFSGLVCFAVRGGGGSTFLVSGSLTSWSLGLHLPSLSMVIGSSSPGGANLRLMYFSIR